MAEAPLWVMFHGLEGSSSSHYALACADYARRQGIGFAVAHFRGCSGELNWAPRAYHSGDYEEIDWVLQRFASLHSGPICAIGISLGGNALLRWAEEAGHSACATVRAIAAVCSPLDLAASGAAMGRGFNRQVYTRMFLRSMKPKALAKLKQHPGLFDPQALMAAQDLYAFDNIFTAPLHGFRDTEDYWKRASAKPHLAAVRVPALAISARNDPFIPTDSLPAPHEVGQYVHLQQFDHGGHVGFAAGMPPGHLATLPQTLGRWFDQHAR
jgi:predicted alpha/beta-fold hydrolase